MASNGIELAKSYVTVIVKAPGIAKSLNQAVTGVDLSAAGKKIGEQLSASVGKSIKSQVAKQFADATAAALEKQTKATKALSDAEHALVKARAQHGSTSAKITGAEERLNSLRTRNADHAQKVADSEAKLEKLRASGTASAKQVEKAEADLEKLRQSGKVSAGDLEKAEAALAKAQAEHATTGRAVASAQNTVAEAKRNATDASQAYSAALEREQSRSERASAWMQIAATRAGEISATWRAAGERITGIGESLTSKITKPAAAAGGAVAGIVGALGFKRLVGIDTARGQFQGLGLDADAVMKQVDAGVTNTSLSMAQGASMAVGILATGSVPLQGLEAQIKRVSNVSAAYGVESEHAAYLLNNVLTKNKVEWGDLSQMQQNQIPIVTQLADYYGVAGDQIMKMAQDGAISVEDLNKVLDINAGAAAESYASTWQGVTANIMSNLGRIGAKFLEPTFTLMKDEAAGFLSMLKSEEFATVATQIGDQIADFVSSTVAGIRDLISWWSRLSPGMQQVIAIAAGVAVAAGPVLIVVGKIATGVGALFSAIKVGIPIVRAFGAALAANPVGAIVTAITALVAGLVWFFSETEVGQKIWGEFTRFLGEAWANISGFFTAAYENVIRPVFEGIKTAVLAVGDFFVAAYEGYIRPVFEGIATVARWVFENILLPLFQLAQFAFAVLGGIFQGVWDFILKPVFDAIGAIFTWLWESVISPVIGWIGDKVRLWGAAMQLLWVRYVQPALKAIGDFFSWLWKSVISPVIGWVQEKLRVWGLATQLMWTTYVKPALDAVGAAFNWIWTNIISPVVDWIKGKLDFLGLAFRIAYEQYIRPAWDAVASKVRAGWEIVKGVIDTMSRIIKSDPKQAFEAARDAIGKAWAGIQDLAKKPVKFVIETVINGLIGTVNKILPDGMKIPEVPLPKGFSDGGYTGNLAASAVAGVVHGNEHVIRAPSRFKIERHHPGLLDHMNKYGEVPGYRTGGLVNPLPRGSYSVSQPYHGGHNGIDLAAPMGTKVYAAGDGVVGLAGVVPMGGNEVYIQHTNGLGTRYSHLSRFATRVGTSVKAGNVIGYVGSTGMSTGPHLHYMVHRPGGGGGNYANHVNPAPYLGMFGADLGEAGGAASILDGLVDWAVSKIKDAFPGGGMWVDVATGLAKNAAQMMAKAFNPFAAADGHTATLYDNGGWLPTGMSLVENRSGRPEPILTGSQWDDLLGSRGGGFPDRIMLLDEDGSILTRARVIAAEEVDRGFEEQAHAERRAALV